MAESSPGPIAPRPTLGLTGLTSNAMALIAPGAFLWLTYAMQSQYGSPMAGMSMWFGIVMALLLCLATAISYAELSKLYPGAGSSYFFAEQAFLSKRTAYKWARVTKFMVGWASHLYYWVYPGVMVGVTALIAGYLVGQIFPLTFNAAVPSLLFMGLFCVVFSVGVAYIAFRGVGGTTGVNAGINVVQIIALIVFSIMAISYRVHHTPGSQGYAIASDGLAYDNVQDTMPDTSKTIADPKNPGKQMQDPAATIPAVDAQGNPVFKTGADSKVIVDYDKATVSTMPDASDATKTVPAFQSHPTAGSVIAPHKFNYVIIQACVAILILVGFESVTAMGEEAKNAKRDIPRAVILSLIIQGGFCYLLEYFAANYFLNTQYTNTAAAGATAPIGDMMQIVGASFFHNTNGGWWFMMIMATTVFLALVGTTLSCMSTGARVTYAMGRDEEVPNHFGMLHGRKLTPHRAIWTLAIISSVLGIFGVLFYFCGPLVSIQSDATIASWWHKNIWYWFGLFKPETAAKFPNSLLIITLVSNFGTFLLYMMTCITAIVAFREHKSFNGFKHMVVPVFGLLANLLCMSFYLIGPFTVAGMSKKEPFIALGVAAAWGIYGAIYFMGRSKKLGRSVLITTPPQRAMSA
ncbi:MAG TPA: APC family permease [Tepidisphaeraceae bacterium]|nr:APC family permease [Tepidisphaeraceae bacterium]